MLTAKFMAAKCSSLLFDLSSTISYVFLRISLRPVRHSSYCIGILSSICVFILLCAFSFTYCKSKETVAWDTPNCSAILLCDVALDINSNTRKRRISINSLEYLLLVLLLLFGKFILLWFSFVIFLVFKFPELGLGQIWRKLLFLSVNC